MPNVLRRLPFFGVGTQVQFRGMRIGIKAHQIIVWVSSNSQRLNALPPNAPRFPAILDTGHSHNFSISEDHLLDWAGLPFSSVPILGRIRSGNRIMPLLAANVWIWHNQPGQRDDLADSEPFRIELDSGISVYPRGTPGTPRLPLLGLRGLCRGNLKLIVDCQRYRVQLKTSRRFWIFG